MGLLKPVGYADIPSEIAGKSFGEQLEILRDMFGIITGSGAIKEGLSQIGGKRLQIVCGSNKFGIFIEDVGLLCFDGEYFIEDIGMTVLPIASGIGESTFCFLVKNLDKGYFIYVYNNTAVPKKFNRGGIEYFSSGSLAVTTLFTSLRAGEALSDNNYPLH